MTAAAPSRPRRVSAREYAQMEGLHEETVTKWCRNACKPEKERNPNLPPMVARRRGRDWQIDVEATEQKQSIAGGTSLEREAAKRR